MNILIYSDNVSANHILYYTLGRLRGKQSVYFVNANEILEGALTQDIDLFVMPGGASRYKAAKLNGEANRLIKRYVEEGGCYLGICAGAYMACETTYWAKDLPYEIITQNELRFFPGIAQGPVEAFGHGDNYNGTAPRVVDLQLLDAEFGADSAKSLYIGGCTFDSDKTSEYEVLARFSELPEKPAAIVQGCFGKGCWLLSSTHPEYDKEALDLLEFDVIGNDYQEYAQVDANSLLDLKLMDYLLKKLER
ncbi:BPL-N domain-containing protein [Vibrio sp. HN007]|uniref:BPL-N domain-containing protein n=1 Tax=Vibrio iocasae TaxID=3098914 RepID=UPI0035D4805D